MDNISFMDTLSSFYKEQVREAIRLARLETVITEQNVYQEGVAEVLPILGKMVSDWALPGSGLFGLEHLKDLYEKAASGKSCLLLLEHYSNYDLPAFIYFLRQAGEWGQKIAEQVVAIAGRKLNEENPAVAAFASAYSRLVIIPSRALVDLDAEKDREELVRSNAINRSAMKTLNKIKYEGKLILVFPAGTRYRPWDPASKRGVREMDSYIKSFDYMSLIGINGELLHVRQGDMLEDSLSHDVLRYTATAPILCSQFREEARAKAVAEGAEDLKQATVDAFMKKLDEIHEAAEIERRKDLK